TLLSIQLKRSGMTAPHCVCPASALLCSALLTRPSVWCRAISSFIVGRPPYKSNFYCHPGRAGGTPMLLGDESRSRCQGAKMADTDEDKRKAQQFEAALEEFFIAGQAQQLNPDIVADLSSARAAANSIPDHLMFAATLRAHLSAHWSDGSSKRLWCEERRCRSSRVEVLDPGPRLECQRAWLSPFYLARRAILFRILAFM